MRARIFAHITIILSFLIWFLTLPLRILPLRRKRIVFFAHGGGSRSNYVCNPKYICESILHKEWADSVELIWLGSNRYNSGDDSGIRWVRVMSPMCVYYLLSSGIIVTNGPLFSWFPFRKKQFCLNTWHGGGAYKKLHSDTKRFSFTERFKRKLLNRNVDVFLSSSRGFMEFVLRAAMGYQGVVLDSGMPRNDILIGQINNIDRQHAIKSRIGIGKNCKVLLFAPTFRDQVNDLYDPINASDVLEVLNHHWPDEWVFLYRIHKKSEKLSYVCNSSNNVIDVTDYDDMQELLLITEVFITDYSSSMWDYALTGRPGLLYVPDWEDYSIFPGLYLEIEDLPFDPVYSMKELIYRLGKLDFGADNTKAERHLTLLGSYEEGRAVDLAVNRIIEVISDLERER